MKLSSHLLFCLLFLAALHPPLRASVPTTLNYQGRVKLSSGTPVPDGLGNTFVFRIYTVATAGSPIWSETWPSTVATKNGLFNVVLGANNPLSIAFDVQYWLGVEVNGDGEMAPRQPMTSAPYAFSANTAVTAANLNLPFSGSAVSGGSPVLVIANTASGGGIKASGLGGTSLQGDNSGSIGFGVQGTASSGGTGVRGNGMTGVAGVANAAGGIGVVADKGTVGALALKVVGPADFTSAGTVDFTGATVSGLVTPPSVPPLIYGTGTPLPILTLTNTGTGTGLSVSAAAAGKYAVNIYNTSGSAQGALYGESLNGGNGIYGVSKFVYGVAGTSEQGDGIHGDTGAGPGSAGVAGIANNNGYGVFGTSAGGIGVVALGLTKGVSATATGVSSIGVYGTSTDASGGIGVLGEVSSGNAAVAGTNFGAGRGISGGSANKEGVYGVGRTGVAGVAATNGIGVVASDNGTPTNLALKVLGSSSFNNGSVTFAAHVDFSGATVTGWSSPAVSAPLNLTNASTAATIFANNTVAGGTAAYLRTTAGSTKTLIVEGGTVGLSLTANLNGTGAFISTSGSGNAINVAHGGGGGTGIFSQVPFGKGIFGTGLVGVDGTGNTGVVGHAGVTGGIGVLADDQSMPNSLALKAKGNALFTAGSVSFTSHVDFTGATVTNLTTNVPVPLSLTGSQNGAAIIAATNQAATGYGLAGLGSDIGVSGTGGSGILGIGVLGQANSTGNGGAGVRGVNSGTGPGVMAVGTSVGLSATSTSGPAVYGRNSAGGGFQPGALFEVQGTNHAVEGRNTGSGSFGTLAGDLSNGQTGVYGRTNPSFNGFRGVWGDSANGFGVYGVGMTGVAGVVTGTGQTAMLADSKGFAGSLALQVNGPANFSNGSVTFAAHVDFGNATITGWSLPANVPVPLSLTGTLSYPAAVISAINNGNGFGLYGVATKPGSVGGNLAMDTTLTAGVHGSSSVSYSAGVLGRNYDPTQNNAGVIGLSQNGTGVLGQAFSASGNGGKFQADSGTALIAQGASGMDATATSPGGYAIRASTNSQNDRLALLVNGPAQFMQAGGTTTTKVDFFSDVQFHGNVSGLPSTGLAPMTLNGATPFPLLQVTNTYTGNGDAASFYSNGGNGISAVGANFGLYVSSTAANGNAIYALNNSGSGTINASNAGSGPALQLQADASGVQLAVSSTTASTIVGINESVSDTMFNAQVWGSNMNVDTYGSNAIANGSRINVVGHGGNAPATGVYAYASSAASAATGVHGEAHTQPGFYGVGVDGTSDSANGFGMSATNSNGSGVGLYATGGQYSIRLGNKLDAGNNRLTNLSDPVFSTDAATKQWVLSIGCAGCVQKSGDSMSGTLSINTNSADALDAFATNPSNIGVHAKADYIGVYAESQNGNALVARAYSSGYYSIYGAADYSGVTGVYGVAGTDGATGVKGQANTFNGVGMEAFNGSGGTALLVNGKSTFNGVATFNVSPDMNAMAVHNVGNPAAGNDAVNLTTMNTAIATAGAGHVAKTGDTMSGTLNVGVIGSGAIGIAAIQSSSSANLTNQGVALQVSGPVRVSSWTNAAETDNAPGVTTYTLSNPRSSGSITFPSGKSGIISYLVTDTNWVGANSIVLVSFSAISNAVGYAVTNQTANSFTVTFSAAATISSGSQMNFIIIRQQ